MKKTTIMMTALSLAVLMSCDTGGGGDDEGAGTQTPAPLPQERTAVIFSAAEISKSRAVGTAWDRGDAIGVFMLESGGTRIADNAANRKYVSPAGDGSFSAADKDAAIYYPADSRSVDFIAYYPYAAAMQGFSYPVDVSSQTRQAKIDLMTADRAAVQGRQPVKLTFKHRLSRVELEIRAGTNLTEEALSGLKAEITGQRVKGSFDINANTLIPSGTEDNSIPLKMAADGKSGEGILLPGEARAGRQLVFALGSKRLRYTIPENNAFKPGTRNKYTITLKGSAPSSTPGEEPDIEVEGEVIIEADIEDWGEGVVEQGGAEPEEPNKPGEPGEPEPEPSKADKALTVGYDRGTVTVTDGAGNPASRGIALSKAKNESLTLKAEDGLERVIWYVNGEAKSGQTFTLRASEAETKPYFISFTGWRNNSYLSSEIAVCIVNP